MDWVPNFQSSPRPEKNPNEKNPTAACRHMTGGSAYCKRKQELKLTRNDTSNSSGSEGTRTGRAGTADNHIHAEAWGDQKAANEAWQEMGRTPARLMTASFLLSGRDHASVAVRVVSH